MRRRNLRFFGRLTKITTFPHHTILDVKRRLCRDFEISLQSILRLKLKCDGQELQDTSFINETCIQDNDMVILTMTVADHFIQ
jgi:hypothetical protein